MAQHTTFIHKSQATHHVEEGTEEARCRQGCQQGGRPKHDFSAGQQSVDRVARISKGVRKMASTSAPPPLPHLFWECYWLCTSYEGQQTVFVEVSQRKLSFDTCNEWLPAEASSHEKCESRLKCTPPDEDSSSEVIIRGHQSYLSTTPLPSTMPLLWIRAEATWATSPAADGIGPFSPLPHPATVHTF